MKKLQMFSMFLTALSFGHLSCGAEATQEFELSVDHDGVWLSAGEETLRYSPLWDGGSNETAKVTLKQGDAVLSENLTAEGDYAWSVSANGTYNLTHTTYTNGVMAKVLNATFVVTGKDIPFPPGSVTATGYNGKYDGNGHGITVTTTDIANPSITYARTEAGPYTETNPLFTNVCNETVWYVVAAPGYITETNSAKVVITKGTIPGGGEEPGPWPIPPGGLSKFDATWVYNGMGQTIDTNKLFTAFSQVMAGEFTVEYGRAGAPRTPQSQDNAISLDNDSGAPGGRALPETWATTPPTIKDVGELVVWYRVTSPNYEPFAPHEAKVTVVPKTVTVEMLAYSDDAFFYDGSKTKVPDVILVDTNDLGVVISTSNDWTRVYGQQLPSGEWPVTITGRNNYTGSASALFKNIKRPVAFPTIPSLSYNKKKQVPNIAIAKDKETGEDLYRIVANPGGIDAGEYTNVVLQLVDTVNHKWKGYAEDGPDTWTGVFVIGRAQNKVNRLPSISSWTNGVQSASVPTMGGSKWGGPAEYIEYRVRGTDPSTGVRKQPSAPGKYTARFVWPEAKNYTACFYDIDFEIFSGSTCPDVVVDGVTVPGTWLAPYVNYYGGGDPETAARATGLNGRPLWQSYVAGLEPNDPASEFTADVSVDANGVVTVTWHPDLTDGNPPRVYTTLGKANLADKDWTPVNDQNKAGMRFFKVQVELGK